MKRLYVGNLHFKATEEELRVFFETAGVKPAEVAIVRDRTTGQSRGFGFIQVSDDAEAEKAVTALNGQKFKGRTVVVNEARSPQPGGPPRSAPQ